MVVYLKVNIQGKGGYFEDDRRSFKNISQVVLLNNKWTGLFILIGLFVADWTVGLAAIIGSLIAYVFARYINYSKEEINDGLAGFNPVLTAVALTIFWINRH